MIFTLKKIRENCQGSVTMEWALLLGVMLYPSYWIVTKLLATLTAYYGLMTTLNALALP